MYVLDLNLEDDVAPRAGAWIETKAYCKESPCYKSLPVRERGLKLFRHTIYLIYHQVAPRAGAWIETN